MQRRSFLRAAASVVPALSLHDLLAASRSESPSPSLRVVGAGKDRDDQPHAMGFSSLLFKVVPSETSGGLFLIEHTHLMPGGPPLHLHPNQEEWFYMIEGAADFQVGDQRLHLTSGESVLAPRGVPHTFSAVGPAPARMLIAFCPAGKMEQYFRDSAGAKPPEDPAAYFKRYDMEYVGPSPFWKS